MIERLKETLLQRKNEMKKAMGKEGKSIRSKQKKSKCQDCSRKELDVVKKQIAGQDDWSTLSKVHVEQDSSEAWAGQCRPRPALDFVLRMRSF